MDEANPVIVAGFGRFGQVITRVLSGLRIGATIDHDPNQIETVRRFGIKAYYGNATRMDVLQAAGAAKARLSSGGASANFDLAEQAPHRKEAGRLIALQQQGRRDIEALLWKELGAQVDQRDARRDQQRGERKAGAERLR